MRGRRGQAAIEFLTTYGWAIMVVLLTIGILGYYGTMNTERFYPERCAFGPGFGCVEYAASSGTDELFFGIQNNLAKTILQANVTVESEECTVTQTYTHIENGDRLLLPGESGKTYTTFPCRIDNTKVKGSITISYILLGQEVTHTAFGQYRLWAGR